MDALPSKYKEGITRVSSIVDFVFPFSVSDDKLFTERLWNKGVDKTDYMNTSKSWGTEVHRCLEEYILGHNPKCNIEQVKDEVQYGLGFIDQLIEKHKGAEIHTEYYILDDRNLYQGTADVVVIDGKSVYIYDWKTYGITKKKFGLPNNIKFNKNGTPAKPTSKIKKVSLQLSLYAEHFRRKGYNIEGLTLVHLHESGAYGFNCDIYSSNDISDIIGRYIKRNIIIPNNFKMEITSPLVISIQTAPIAFSAVKVELDLQRLSGTDIKPSNAINELVEVQKKLHNSYLPKDVENE